MWNNGREHTEPEEMWVRTDESGWITTATAGCGDGDARSRSCHVSHFWMSSSVFDIPYCENPHPNQHLDLYIPEENDPANINWDRMVVYIHGGAWRTGDRSQFRKLGQQFSQLGFPTCVIGYRLSPKIVDFSTDTPKFEKDAPALYHPAHLEDCARAIAWLWKRSGSYIHPDGSDSYRGPKRFYLVGHSAGAHINGMLMFEPEHLERLGGRELFDAIAGVVDVEGIFDIPLLSRMYPSYNDFIYGAFTKDVKAWVDASPRFKSMRKLTEEEERTLNLKGGDGTHCLPPYLIVQSLEDELLSPDQAVQYFEHILKEGGVGAGRATLDTTSLQGSHSGVLRKRAFFDTVAAFVNGVDGSFSNGSR
ncbi:Alpha/Beta hydrolase protein [Cladochytrium replicatum]|nr:Alpha/Beta hydrolase protein [Cladochytrium replicatum]